MKIARYTVLNDNFTKYFSIKLKIGTFILMQLTESKFPFPNPEQRSLHTPKVDSSLMIPKSKTAVLLDGGLIILVLYTR